MHQEPADKFRTGDRDCLLVAGFVVTGVEGHHTIRNAHDSGVGDSDFVGISSEVLNRIAIAVDIREVSRVRDITKPPVVPQSTKATLF